MCNYQVKGYRRLHVLTMRNVDYAVAQPSGDKTHLGYLNVFKQIDRIKRVETGDTRLGCLKYGIWLA